MVFFLSGEISDVHAALVQRRGHSEEFQISVWCMGTEGLALERKKNPHIKRYVWNTTKQND